MHLKIGWLYPDLLNLYGDRGNIECLTRRCRWRGFGVSVENISLETELTNQLTGSIDIIFAGGGPDLSQKLVADDLVNKKGDFIKGYIENDGVGLFVCGSYQLLGHYYRPWEGEDLPGLGVFDLYTKHFGLTKKRCVGNVVVEANWLPGKTKTLVGFENHGGRTYLGPDIRPLGIVKRGFGNNGEDKTEGAIYKNAFGTYLHGPILPKNPHFADYLIETALERRYGGEIKLEDLDDMLEWQAHQKALRIA